MIYSEAGSHWPDSVLLNYYGIYGNGKPLNAVVSSPTPIGLRQPLSPPAYVERLFALSVPVEVIDCLSAADKIGFIDNLLAEYHWHFTKQYDYMEWHGYDGEFHLILECRQRKDII